MELTPGEERVLRAICACYGPLGISALGVSKSLNISRNTVSTIAQTLVRKGYCVSERVGMRVYLKPTPSALAACSNGEIAKAG
jgi:DNA-binding IclR family transcriptional regulator